MDKFWNISFLWTTDLVPCFSVCCHEHNHKPTCLKLNENLVAAEIIRSIICCVSLFNPFHLTDILHAIFKKFWAHQSHANAQVFDIYNGGNRKNKDTWLKGRVVYTLAFWESYTFKNLFPGVVYNQNLTFSMLPEYLSGIHL